MYEMEMEKVGKQNSFYINRFSCLKKFEILPARVWICVMMFTATWVSYTSRLQFGSIIPAMIDKSESNDTRDLWDISSNTTFHEWPASTVRKYGLMAYGIGNVPGNLVGGTLSINLGPRALILWTTLVSAVVGLLTPVIANLRWEGLVFARFIIGLMGGVTFPACHALVSQWAPPVEKSRFVWSLLGGTAGSIVILPMLSSLTERVSWEMAWIIPSILILIWLTSWMIWAWDSPSEHPFIKEEEKTYITQSQAGTKRTEKLLLKEMPLGAMCTSIPFLALIICHFGNIYLIFFYQSYMITYLVKARGSGMEKSGIMASAPWLGRFIAGFFFSWAGDIVKKKKIVSLTVFRKLATIFSHLIPGICLIIAGHISSLALANVVFCIALSSNGAASIANLTNNQDLSPNYAGFLYGVMNFFGSMASVVLPSIVERFIADNDTDPESWQKVFYAGGSVCILCMVVFVIGGSAEIQSWNTPKTATTA